MRLTECALSNVKYDLIERYMIERPSRQVSHVCSLYWLNGEPVHLHLRDVPAARCYYRSGQLKLPTTVTTVSYEYEKCKRT